SSCFSRCLRVPIAMRTFYEPSLWILQHFLLTHLDLHHRLLGTYWMTGGVGLPMTTEARETAYRRLAAEGLLVDGIVTDRRRMALVTVRACLETGAAEHVAYEDPRGRARGNDTASHAPRRSIPASGRNDPCPCGSGKKYKKCCGATIG
ncbi:MAG: SEC-C metal-binding domain-containing protein, partial [Candidatus Korobacteraceae bacterium]